MNTNELDILEYNGEGYKTVHIFESWRVAFLNYSDRFTTEGMKYLERHNQTDEIFILAEGKATLLIGLDKKEYVMEIGKMYNVKRGAWHNILTSKDAKVIIMENADTSSDNSEYHYF